MTDLTNPPIPVMSCARMHPDQGGSLPARDSTSTQQVVLTTARVRTGPGFPTPAKARLARPRVRRVPIRTDRASSSRHVPIMGIHRSQERCLHPANRHSPRNSQKVWVLRGLLETAETAGAFVMVKGGCVTHLG